MVLAFLLHTVCAAPARILYQRVFSCGSGDEERTEQMEAVARQVEALCLLRRRVSPRLAVVDVEEAGSLQEEDVGVLGFPPGGLFPQEVTVLWVGVQHLGFSLICDPGENLALAEMTLRGMVKHLLETLRLLTHSNSALLRPDLIQLTLDTFIPQGALLFLSHQATQVLERELSASITL